MILLKPLYRVNLIEENNQHRYTINEDPTFLPGVTGILNQINKPFLLQWAAKETALYMHKIVSQFSHRAYELDFELLIKRSKKHHRFIKETAARRGSEAHVIFDAWIKHAPQAFDKTLFAASFNCWLKNNPFRIIAGDTKIASIQYGYGGSLDAIAEENGKIIVIDFKTGKNIYETHAYQVASYSYALKETYGLNYYPESQIIRFEKDSPKFERRKVRDIHDSFKAFKAALDLYKSQQLVHFIDREIIKEKLNATNT